MAISPIGAAGGLSVTPATYLSAPAPTPSAAGDNGFAASLTGAVDNLQGLQSTSNELAIRAVTGDLADVHDYTIASTEAAVALELTAAIRNKAVDAFSEIMRMQA